MIFHVNSHNNFLLIDIKKNIDRSFHINVYFNIYTIAYMILYCSYINFVLLLAIKTHFTQSNDEAHILH